MSMSHQGQASDLLASAIRYQRILEVEDLCHKYHKAMCRKAVAMKQLDRWKDQILEHITGAKETDVVIDPDLIAQWAKEAQAKKYKTVLDASEEEAKDLAVTIKKSICLITCEMMQQKLPRELRDMIYEILLPVSTTSCPDRVWSGKVSSKCTGCYFNQTPTPECRRHGSLYLRNSEYVGQQTVTELAETWYRTSEFDFFHGSTLDDLLDENPWNISFQPCSLIHRVHISLSKYEMLEQVGQSKKWEIPTNTPLRLHNTFSPLFQLKAGAKITVRFIVFTKDWEEAGQKPQKLIDMLGSAFSMCKSLLDQGYQVKVLQRWGASLPDQKTLLTAKEWVESNRFQPRSGQVLAKMEQSSS